MMINDESDVVQYRRFMYHFQIFTSFTLRRLLEIVQAGARGPPFLLKPYRARLGLGRLSKVPRPVSTSDLGVGKSKLPKTPAGAHLFKYYRVKPDSYTTMRALTVIKDLIELESNSEREEDILLLHDLYTKGYLVPRSSIKHSKTYTIEDLMQLSPSSFMQLTLLFKSFVAVGLSCLGSNENGASIGKIQMIFGVGEGTVVLYTKWVIQAIHKGFPNYVGFVNGTSLPLSQKPALEGNNEMGV
ncbi:hypothetical protein PPACK8108_LOCUS25069 [Phakopsora pachyrhizi]|uniref:Uncharacterized protein n=1 Tax=Phakopsora pachyrhizi TaxID=170000 RepID=A0AAV0BR66_PHAPC|nr:hypothetical protein PPACK8108_LOCUS25069 [Phakopsora pachyrhizi]